MVTEGRGQDCAASILRGKSVHIIQNVQKSVCLLLMCLSKRWCTLGTYVMNRSFTEKLHLPSSGTHPDSITLSPCLVAWYRVISDLPPS